MKLYKYMNQSTAMNFLREPYFRITPSTSLNDPFEITLSSKNSDELNKLSKKHKNELGNTYSNFLNQFMNDHGILSFSESYDNLLMWAHYAEDHKGIVIELDIDENNPFSLFNVSSIPQSSYANFLKVNYRKTRSYPEEITPKNIDNGLVQHYYRTKSDEWLYEKEWRFILPFTIANKVLVNTDVPDSHKALEYLDIPFDKEKKGIIDVTLSIISLISLNPKKVSHIYRESYKNGFIFLIRLDDTKINRLFLGMNVCLPKIVPKIDKAFGIAIYKYRHIFGQDYRDVYTAKRDPNRFELIFEPLQPDARTE